MKKRSVNIAGHPTSVSIEDAFWHALKEIATAENRSLNDIITEIDNNRDTNLSSALRLYVLKTLQNKE